MPDAAGTYLIASQDVCSLDVSVHDALLMEIRQTMQHLRICTL